MISRLNMHTIKPLKSFLAVAFFTFCGATNLEAQDRPNILFLVVEDTSPYLFPVYGNKDIQTPNIDFLAANGVAFNNAFSNAPYCSPARSSLISGSYATTYGTDIHRNRMVVPQEYFFPQYLREAGYYTLNVGKTDYNITNEVGDKFIDLTWDKKSGYYGNKPNASYNDKERANKPFFAQFNNGTTHMSRMTSVTVEARGPLKLDSSKIQLPPHVPDLPEMKADYTVHLEGVQDADKWVGIFLNDLKKRKLLDNTIIFFFSDHGGCLPRGKAFPFESGMKAGLVIYAPDKWKHLLPAPQGSTTDQLVEFADFGPTLLSLAGAEVPKHMQGMPFMGNQKSRRDYAFAFRTNSGDHHDPARCVFDENYQYIKFYMPYKRYALRQSFQWGMPAQLAWDEYYLSGNAHDKFKGYYETKPVEMLFDMKQDPYSLENLIDKPEHKQRKEKFRTALKNHIRNTKDLGFFPRDVRDGFTKRGISLYEWVRENDYDFEFLYETVEKAADPKKSDVAHFERLLTHERPEVRYWAASGLTYLAQQKKIKEPKALLTLAEKESFPTIKAIAAEGLVYMDSPEGLNILLSEIRNNSNVAASSLENVGSYAKDVLDELEAISEEGGKAGFTVKSILINFGRLPMSALFEEKQRKKFVKNHFKKVENWAPSLPGKKNDKDGRNEIN